MPSDTLNVGLIGAGRIGRVHAANLATRIPKANLVVVADVVEGAARELAGRYRVPRVAGDYRSVLDSPDVEAVLICSATDTHAQIIEEAARAGKHIFCEKPIALSLPAIDRALSAVEKAGVKLQIGFNRRFDANFGRVRRAVEQGEIGRVELLHITSRDPSPPPIEYVKVSGGIFLDMTIHDFDMARFLAGDEVEEVFTTAGVMVDSRIGEAGDVDTAVTVLKFAHGAIGTIDATTVSYPGLPERIELACENATALLVAESLEVHIKDGRTLHRAGSAAGGADPMAFSHEAHKALIMDFLDALDEEREPRVSGREAIRVQALIEAILESATSERVVEVPQGW